MYLWHVIKPVCLDWEITPCLPTNKPSAVVSNPLFIIHNPLWCQGQSDCIVMVKGKLEEPELSTGTENPGNERTKVEIWRLRASSLTQRARNWHIKKWKCTAKLRLMINSVGFVCLFVFLGISFNVRFNMKGLRRKMLRLKKGTETVFTLYISHEESYTWVLIQIKHLITDLMWASHQELKINWPHLQLFSGHSCLTVYVRVLFFSRHFLLHK